jgi:adenylyltransferase/sulfurtransferase
VSAVFTADELRRYSRHLVLPEVGVEGQRRLQAASVVCVGAGGLGSPVALYLAAAGVGRLGVVDFDVVDASNLHRQVLYSASDVGRSKVASARDRVMALNPDLVVQAFETRLSPVNAREILGAFDIVVDGSDNFGTRYLVNDACVMLGTPCVHGAVSRFEGQASVFAAAGGPCYRCLHPEPPPPGLVPGCADAGVLGVLPGVIGTLQATEVLKLILGVGKPLVGRLLTFDALALRFEEIALGRDPDCPVCGARPTIRELTEYEGYCQAPDPAGRATEAATPFDEAGDVEITVEELKARLDGGDDVVLLDVREPHETFICNLPNSTLIPMAEIPRRMGEIDRQRDVVVYCRSGARSGRVVAFLRRQGFERVMNLRGGMLDWIDRIDPTQPKY